MDGEAESYFCFSPSSPHQRTPVRPRWEDTGDDFLFDFSACNTPVAETPPVEPGTNATTRYAQHLSPGPRPHYGSPKHDTDSIRRTYAGSPVERSRPIPIGDKRSKTTALVEESSRRPHARHIPRSHRYSAEDAWRARQPFVSEAETPLAPIREVDPPIDLTSPDAVVVIPPERPTAGIPARKAHRDDRRRPAPSRKSRTTPIVDAYNPTGLPGSIASLGKYYPSNYEASSRSSPSSSPSSSSPPPPPSSAKSRLAPAASDSAVPSLSVLTSNLDPNTAHNQQHRRLLQYKRDLINQTLQNAREALGRTMHSPAALRNVEGMLDEGSRRSVASGFALLRRYKPSSPRITPLLSPGPVTPMALDEAGEGDYLTAVGVSRRAVRSR